MANIDKILHNAEQQIVQLAGLLLTKYKGQAMADAQDFIRTTKADLTEWVSALQAGQLDKDDFESLVRGEKDLAEMRALKQEGLTQIAIDGFTNGITQILINSAFAALGL